jgi:hypothetical protein
MTADAVPDELAAALRDPQSMTPQQLADAATLVSNLPPEEQQRLMEAARASAQVTGGGAATQPRLSVARPTLPPLLPPR